MELIIHKINTIAELNKIPREYGCEIDIRTNGSKIILNHDPFKKGDAFIDYLDEYKNGTLVLNIKESGIEDLVLEEVRKRDIKSFFLLDVEFPYIYSSSKRKEKNIAVRFSEKEPIQNAIIFKDKLKWIWIDTITSLPLNQNIIDEIKGFKTCLVCPERWGRPSDIERYRITLKNLCFTPDAVMTNISYAKYWQ
jgi:hypothetical protein